MKEPVQVAILGQSFTLRSDAGDEEVRRVAEFVNRTIAEVSAAGKSVDSLNVSLLALMNVAQAYLQLRDAHQLDAQDAIARLKRLTRRMEEASRTAPEKNGTMSLYGDF